MPLTVREARRDDRDDVAAFTRATWTDRDEEDYLPAVFPDWVAGDGETSQTFVADVDGTAVGVVRVVLQSPDEAWVHGMRVDPSFRGHDAATHLANRSFAWARERDASVARNMVFSWNVAGLGHSRAVGFEPATEFRWAEPDPNPDAETDAAPVVEAAAATDVDAADAWRFFTGADARTALRGLVLDGEQPWSVSELTREALVAAADAGRLAVVRRDGVTGFTYRNRVVDRGGEGEGSATVAEYAVAAWTDLASARALFAAVARDAARVDATRTRVLIPEGVRWVSDVAATRTAVSEQPDFVLEKDLSR